MFQVKTMPPTKASLKSFKFFSEAEFTAYQESEAESERKKLIEIEASLVIENGLYFNIDALLNDKSHKNVGQAIFSYLDFESLIQARMIKKSWYSFLDRNRELWIAKLREKLDFLKKGSLCDYNHTYIHPKYPKIQVLFKSNENSLQWESYARVIEQNGSVSEFITFIQRMEDSYDRKNTYSDDFEVKIIEATYQFELSPLEAAIKHGKYHWCDLKFLKLLKNHKLLCGIDHLAKDFVFWAVAKMQGTKALECVLSILKNNPLYCHYDLQYDNSVLDPINYAIKEQELFKLRLLIPLAVSSYWNSDTLDHFGFREGHTPLTDAIMIGNYEIFITLLPLTNIENNPDFPYGSYLHVAIKYGQTEIFKHLCTILKDWKQLKNRDGLTVYQVLMDKNYAVEINKMEPGPICSDRKYAHKEITDEFRQKIVEFMKEN